MAFSSVRIAMIWPWAKTAAQSAGIATAADVTTQWFMNKGNVPEIATSKAGVSTNLDMRRAASIGAFGFFYSGGLQRLIYQKFDASFGTKATMQVVAKKVAADSFLHGPILYVPAFYMFTGLLQGKSLDEAFGRLCAMYKDTVATYLMIWPAAMFGLFWAVPEARRIVTLACLAFGEKAVYSMMELNRQNSSEVVVSMDVRIDEVQKFAALAVNSVPSEKEALASGGFQEGLILIS
mmetsp:Transcript_31627/g.104819  ORF Transcript_31627/g.104819 Transcript_31627/m.104819 type:complete len:236 (-) Transcript_31627:292-999(-)|eukprot:CAMPEP_0204123312 /NCGR_PEP_ID=MMETSP0361-20130328/9220_1 /ASSEMBLY_ACC=CAM_ASM_000343 /TAXON_ID=268821 /ORGANISM="Scrippsiella Hangoei, Strain SHTV-5" /LENGTH=235 /DNA_ID=CAMNT_0051074749 /DNA_START=48 /DNA_END=755 /DNA_ORIENTATION=-